MKSKICLFPIVFVLCIKLNGSKPTFGDEFVHIKVHLPKEGGEAHAHHGSPQIYGHPVVHAPVAPHRVVHHFHHKRRRPAKKTAPFDTHTGLLEPTASFENGYQYMPHKQAETAKVIEGLIDDYHTDVLDPDYQYLTPKKQRIKTVKIIDNHEHEPIGHEDYGNGSLEYDAHDDSYHYALKQHAENIKIVETKTPHQHSHDCCMNFDERPQSDTVEIVKANKPSKSSSYYNRQQHQQQLDWRQKDDGYHYKRPIMGSTATKYDDGFSVGYDCKTRTHENTYGAIPEDHNAKEPEQYAPEDSYLPPKRLSSASHHHHYHQQPQHNNVHSNVRQNSLYDDKPESAIGGAMPSPEDATTTLPELDHGTAHWSQHDAGYKVNKTYAGIDSYSAAHVQGLGSGGYQYPSPYP